MSKILTEAEIMKKFFEKYEKDPSVFSMYTAFSPMGFPELIIENPSNKLLIKRLYPGFPGIGGILEEDVDIPSSPTPTGLRPVPITYVKKMQSIVEEGVPLTEAMNIIVKLLTQRPITFEEYKRVEPESVGYTWGPLFSSSRPLSSIIRGQSELYRKLDEELSNLKRRNWSTCVT